MIDWLFYVKAAVGIIKDAGGLIKPKGKFKDIAVKPEFQQAFLKQQGNNIIVNVKGDFYLGDSDAINKLNKKELLDGFRPTEKVKPKKDVSFFEVAFYPRILKFSRTKISDEKLDKYLEYTEPLTQNLFGMSFYVKALFEEGNSKEANNIKSDIGTQYGKFGRKFCNLYIKGYIHEFVEYLIVKYGDNPEKLKKDYNSEIEHFVIHSNTIFFIYEGEEYLKMIPIRILIALNSGEPYIALHAGNKTNIENSKRILSKVKESAIEKGYSIKEKLLMSKSKTPLYDIYITRENLDENTSREL